MRKAITLVAAAGGLLALVGVPTQALAIGTNNTEVATLINLSLTPAQVSAQGLGKPKTQTINSEMGTDHPMEICLVEAIHMYGGDPAPTFVRGEITTKRNGLTMSVENEEFLYAKVADAKASYDNLVAHAALCEEGPPVKVTHGLTSEKIAGVKGVWIRTQSSSSGTQDEWYRAYFLAGRSITMVGYYGSAAMSPVTSADRAAVRALAKTVAKGIAATLG